MALQRRQAQHRARSGRPCRCRPLRRLTVTADVVLEAEPWDRPGRLRLDHPQLQAGNERLIWASVTPFGRSDQRSGAAVSDLTVLAAGGPVWSCGYDDHSLPPIRGEGNQGYQTGSVWAVIGILVALVNRNRSGLGQHIDVSLHAAGIPPPRRAPTPGWSRATVQRQTGRHATSGGPTGPTQTQAADGRWVSTGVPPQTKEKFAALLGWMEELKPCDELGRPDLPADGRRARDPSRRGGPGSHDDRNRGGGREALILLASKYRLRLLHRGPGVRHSVRDHLRTRERPSPTRISSPAAWPLRCSTKGWAYRRLSRRSAPLHRYRPEPFSTPAPGWPTPCRVRPLGDPTVDVVPLGRGIGERPRGVGPVQAQAPSVRKANPRTSGSFSRGSGDLPWRRTDLARHDAELVAIQPEALDPRCTPVSVATSSTGTPENVFRSESRCSRTSLRSGGSHVPTSGDSPRPRAVPRLRNGP